MRRLDAAVFLSGAALMGLEIAGSRVLAPVFGTSIFVWGALITTFLASLALGYALGGRLADRYPRPALLGNLLFGAGVLLWLLFFAPAPVLSACAAAPLPERFRSLVAALVLFAPPSVLMGAVTPFAVRLAARDLESVGTAAGRLSAVSTAGSILGTFTMTFFLIPAFPTRPILFGLGLALVASGLLVPGSAGAAGLARAALAGGAAGAAFLVVPQAHLAPDPAGTVVYDKETAYHHLRVLDLGRRRKLVFNNVTQGFVPTDPSQEMPANYTDGLLFSMAFRRTPSRSVVVVGLGAGMIPSLLSRRAPEVETTTIEIDPEVVRTARRFFRFAPDANDRVLVGDGRYELARQTGPFDVILEDAFIADSIPFHMITREFFELCRDRLSPDGVYAANFVGLYSGSGNALFWSAHRTLAEVFPRVYVLSGELAGGRPDFLGNAILVATRSADRLDRGTLQERAEELARRLQRAEISEWGPRLYDGELHSNGLPVLTDSYSPTDSLQHLIRR